MCKFAFYFIEMLFNIHTHFAQNQREIQNYYPEDIPEKNPFSVGIHPWYIEENWQKQMDNVLKYSVLENCKAIGECGLDKNVKTNFSLQKEIFKAHIALSEQVKKPLLIHCVKSFSEIISLKKETRPSQLWVLHGFRKNEQIANALLQNNIKISFGEALLKEEKLQKILTKISINDFFLETDNASVSIQKIYQKASELTGFSVENLNILLSKKFNNF
ncbi:MAG: TatD family hydrolase [Capnocytophaga sp.]|nr:TatD family hydrolase [Capnocytophaga sp.]